MRNLICNNILRFLLVSALLAISLILNPRPAGAG
jgi:hypothetical protein